MKRKSRVHVGVSGCQGHGHDASRIQSNARHDPSTTASRALALHAGKLYTTKLAAAWACQLAAALGRSNRHTTACAHASASIRGGTHCEHHLTCWLNSVCRSAGFSHAKSVAYTYRHPAPCTTAWCCSTMVCRQLLQANTGTSLPVANNASCVLNPPLVIAACASLMRFACAVSSSTLDTGSGHGSGAAPSASVAEAGGGALEGGG